MNFKSKLSFSKSIATIIGLVCIALSCFIFQGCEKDENELLDKDENELLDKVILNSSEFEDYIITGADLKQSLAVFKSRLNKIDFSKLEVTYDAEGRKVVHLSPGLVGNFRIEEKVQMFNEKKEAMQRKFPQFVSFREAEANKYFQKSIENSVNIIGEFLKLGINISSPKLKSANESWYGDENLVFMNSFLYNWINSASYVELYIIYYADGTFGTYQNPQATSSWTSITYSVSNGQMYFPQGGSSSAVVSIGHTHRVSSTPSTTDNNGNYPSSVTRFIYYNWGMYYY